MTTKDRKKMKFLIEVEFEVKREINDISFQCQFYQLHKNDEMCYNSKKVYKQKIKITEVK